jgi:predicted PurR-regulated permease PerM
MLIQPSLEQSASICERLDRFFSPTTPHNGAVEEKNAVRASIHVVGDVDAIRETTEMEQSSRTEDPRRWPPLSYWVKVAVAVALTLYVLQLLRSVLNVVILVVIAAVLAIGVDPAVRRLERRMSRGTAVALLFAAITAFVFIFASLVVPPLVRQFGGLASDAPRYAQQLAERDDVIGRYFREHDLTQTVENFIADLPTRISQSFSTILGFAGRVTGTVFNVVTVAILMIYFMLSLPRMRRTSAMLFAPERRARAENLIDESVMRIGGYVSGNLVTSLICGVVAMIALVALGVPFAIPLGLWAGIADLIPAVGAYLGAIPAVIVAFFESPVTGVLTLVYFVVYQQVENYYIVPKVMQGAVNLSPAAVIVSTLIGGSLFGFAGALLALPVAATIKVILYEMWLHERLESGDVLVREHIEAEKRAASEGEAEATARAETHRRRLARLKHAFRPTRSVPEREASHRDEQGPAPQDATAGKETFRVTDRPGTRR